MHRRDVEASIIVCGCRCTYRTPCKCCSSYLHLDRFLASLPRRFAGAFLLREPEPLDPSLPLRVPAGAVGDLPVGERSFATQVVYFILWVTFGNVDYFLTFASVSDVRQNLGQPDGASSFSSHASFTGPFLVLDADSAF